MAALIVEAVLAAGEVTLAGRLPGGLHPCEAILRVVRAVPAHVHIGGGSVGIVGIEHVIVAVGALAGLVLEGVVVDAQRGVHGIDNLLVAVAAEEADERPHGVLSRAAVEDVVAYVAGGRLTRGGIAAHIVEAHAELALCGTNAHIGEAVV